MALSSTHNENPGAADISVFGLLSRLSEVLVNENEPFLSGKQLKNTAKMSRSTLYEILLEKSHVKDVCKLSVKFDQMSPLSCLVAWRFFLESTERDGDSSELDEIIREVFQLGWDDFPHPVLRTLICLADASSISSLAVPNEPFCLSKKLGLANIKSDSSRSSRIYPSLPPDIFKPPAWMSLNHSVSPLGGYVTSFPFNKEPGKGLPLYEKFIGALSTKNASVSSPYQLCPIPTLTGPRDLTVSSNLGQVIYEDEGYFTPITEVANPSHNLSESKYEDPTKVWSEALKTSLPERKSWETLGNLESKPEPPFLSAAGSDAVYNLSVHVNICENIFKTQHQCDLKPTLKADLVRDIFFLLIGVESINFPFIEESDCFVARKGMWLEGYSVDSTSTLCQDFLFCGTHFRRLENLSNFFHTKENIGLVVHSLMDCVQHWTQFYRGAVLILSSRIKSKGHLILLYELLEYTQALKKQVECLSSLCCIDGSKNILLPSGVALLAHIYREACETNTQQSNLLYSALRSCCEAYLHCLQRWIFLGDCTDVESNEFFVSKDQMFSTKRDRTFWVQAFILDKSAVPSFLQGIEEAVFDCGRAMNLLYLCSPQHPLCVLLEKKVPTLHCCLYKSDLEKVQKECAQFEKEAQRVCGEFMNVSKLLEKEKEKEAQLHVLKQKALKHRDAVCASIKMQVEKAKAEMRERQSAALKAQILEMQQRREAEKEQMRKDDEQYLLECKRLDDAAKLIQEEERQKLLAHYEELGKIVDKQNQLREWQIKRLKMADQRQTFLLEDSLRLSKEHLLLNEKPETQSNFEVCANEVSSEAKSQVSFFHSPSQESCASLSLMSNSTITESQTMIEETSSLKDAFHEACNIKAKVLQMEFGISTEMPAASQTKAIAKLSAENDSGQTESTESSLFNEEILTRDSAVAVTYDTESSSKSLKGKSDAECDVSDGPERGLVLNRHRVMTEDKSWKSSENLIATKKPSKDSGITLEWERNRQKILGGEYNILTGVKVSDIGVENLHQKRVTENSRNMTELQRNRKKVLGEEYNILTGEEKAKDCITPVSVTVTKADSGIDTLPSQCDTDTYSDLVPETSQRSVSGIKDENSDMPVSERPKILSFNSTNSMSPLTTPLDLPVFTSPFRGTNLLPNELPLASPPVDFCCQNPTHFEVHGIPLIIDIADNFASRFNDKDTTDYGSSHTGDTEDKEILKTPPNSSWLESSLQTCLLLPLRVQYQYVSAALLHFFLVDLKLLDHFRSLRAYYFMQDGEFGRHLTVKLFTEMYQVSSPDKLFNTLTLDRVINEALASSQSTADPNHSLLNLTVYSVPHHFSHSSPHVLDCLRLSYKVKWPLNILLTPQILEKYNLIFLFLVRLKRVAWLLQGDFVVLKNTARRSFKGQHKDLINSPQYHQVQMIRQGMSQFVQATLNYVCSSVLHASWTNFASSLKQATTLDHIHNAHIEYLKCLLNRCLLSSSTKRVEAVLSKILICIIKFHVIMRNRPWQIPSKVQGHRSQSIYLEHPDFQLLSACFNHFKLQVCKLLSYLERLISPPNQHQHLSDYLLLLNINGFYESSDYLKYAETALATAGKSASTSQSSSKVELTV